MCYKRTAKIYAAHVRASKRISGRHAKNLVTVAAPKKGKWVAEVEGDFSLDSLFADILNFVSQSRCCFLKIVTNLLVDGGTEEFFQTTREMWLGLC